MVEFPQLLVEVGQDGEMGPPLEPGEPPHLVVPVVDPHPPAQDALEAPQIVDNLVPLPGPLPPQAGEKARLLPLAPERRSGAT